MTAVTDADSLSALTTRAQSCAERIRSSEAVLLASHIDADGLTSAAIAATALERADIPFEVVFEKQLDDAALARIAQTTYDTVLFTDFGSGQLDRIAEHENADAFTPVICDHHQPADGSTTYHCNPLLEGIDGASALSGAGVAYLLAQALDGGDRNRDLAALAVVGAVGDMQATDDGLGGVNATIVEEGIEAGVLEERPDLSLFGRQTRPLPQLLQYSSDVHLPGITNDRHGSMRFCDSLPIDLKADGEWLTWVELSADQRKTVVSALVQHALERGVTPDAIEDLVGTTYTLVSEPEGTELRDASEFSTLLNATARYERADVGLAVCLGNRDGALDRAQSLLATHRRNLSSGIEWVQNNGVTRCERLQWFDAGDEIRETIVGIVAGMALGTANIDRDRPIVGFAEKTATESKVSARGTGRLVAQGLDLSTVMGEASRAVGGDGGGHDIAAGATIPSDQRDAFIEYADELVVKQLA